MTYPLRPACLMMALLLFATIARAQTLLDPSGHWEGAIRVPHGTLDVIFDFSKDDAGRLVGTMTNRAERVVGLPFTKISVDGQTITFSGRSDQAMVGVVAADGTTMKGTATLGGYALPFSAERTGTAIVPPFPRSKSVSRTLEGRWTGRIVAAGSAADVVLAIDNQPDGTARAHLIHVNQGGLTIPMVVAQDASTVSLTTPIVDLSFSGSLDVSGSELVGAIVQGNVSVPVTLRRAAGGGAR